jgi:predicted metalloprotease with PDZ domain
MKRIVLIAGAVFAVHGAFAADATPKAAATTATAPATTSASAAAPAASAQASAEAKSEAARAELAELRTQVRELTRKMAALSSELGESSPRSYALRYMGDPGRAMIGVVLDEDPKGVRLSAVTPDGPAARAGLRDGDVITAIDKQPIAAKTPEAALTKARELLGNLKEGQKVGIEYLRGTQKSTVTLAAKRREASNWAQMMNEDPDHPFLPKDFNERMRADMQRAQRQALSEKDRDHIRADVEMARAVARVSAKNARTMTRLAMPWWGLNLAPLNADLGRYFGTDKGVLVIATDEDSLPGIRAGDVITSVAGETVARPEDALRALRDQPSGKDIPIQVLRERKTLALNMKAPEFNSIFNLEMPPPPAPPVPPTPPTAPAAPSAPAPATAPTPPAPPVPPSERSARDDHEHA